MMDIQAVERALQAYVATHDHVLQRAAFTAPQLLELGGAVLAVEHYERNGYTVRVAGARRDEFVVKTSARGYPWNFSYFEALGPRGDYEIRSNLAIESAYGLDDGFYVVDVGIVRLGSLPGTWTAGWRGAANRNVVSFIEAKKLVVYPMLLAQFLGIVFELKPEFLGGRLPWGFRPDCHFFPCLVTIGYLHPSARRILNGYRARRFRVGVVPAFDLHIARLQRNPGLGSILATEV